MAIVFHGTTLWRAQRILLFGPNPDFTEPNGKTAAENFSVCLTFGPFECTSTPEEYGWGKARAAVREGRDEGGAAVVIVDIPEELLDLAVSEWFPLSQGFVQFDRGPSLNALLTAWPGLMKRVMPFKDPKP